MAAAAPGSRPMRSDLPQVDRLARALELHHHLVTGECGRNQKQPGEAVAEPCPRPAAIFAAAWMRMNKQISLAEL